MDEAVHFARMVSEIYEGKVDLKNPNQIPVEAKTDNKGLWENLNNSRQCDEKLLRNSISLMKEMLERGEVTTRLGRHLQYVSRHTYKKRR